MKPRPPRIPEGPSSIQKGVPLKLSVNKQSIECLAQNIRYVYPDFEVRKFSQASLKGLDDMELLDRCQHIAACLHEFLPKPYSEAIEILINSFTPKKTDTNDLAAGGFFYMPHNFFISDYGLDKQYNNKKDPFNASMKALYELTTRFSSELAIRVFLIEHQERSFKKISKWVKDPNPHVRRLCSEGTRPKLPWAKRIPSLIKDPTPSLPILEALKNDESLYVRRSVANHMGDIAKDHPELVFETCERWLDEGASKELKWVIRHALRYPAKKENPVALDLRIRAK
jgi:3-methyladenine DNA glycosylase AlkC